VEHKGDEMLCVVETPRVGALKAKSVGLHCPTSCNGFREKGKIKRPIRDTRVWKRKNRKGSVKNQRERCKIIKRKKRPAIVTGIRGSRPSVEKSRNPGLYLSRSQTSSPDGKATANGNTHGSKKDPYRMTSEGRNTTHQKRANLFSRRMPGDQTKKLGNTVWTVTGREHEYGSQEINAGGPGEGEKNKNHGKKVGRGSTSPQGNAWYVTPNGLKSGGKIRKKAGSFLSWFWEKTQN